MSNRNLCQARNEVKAKPYSPKVLVGTWENERCVPNYHMTSSEPLPSRYINGYKTTYKTDYLPIMGYKENSIIEEKLQYLTELPFQGHGLGSSVKYPAKTWISEMKDEYRDPQTRTRKHM